MTTADGLPLAVHERGDPAAPTVLCVHGYPDNSSVWDGVAARLADRYHVVAYDVRGAGASPLPGCAPATRWTGWPTTWPGWPAPPPRRAGAPARARLGVARGLARGHRRAARPGVRLLHLGLRPLPGPRRAVAPLPAAALPRDLLAFADQAVRSGYIGFFHLPVLPELAWLTGAGGAVLGALDRIGRPRSAAPPRRTLRDHLNGLDLYRENFRARLRAPSERRTAVPVQVLIPADEVFMTEGLQTASERWTEDFRAVPVQGGHWVPRSRPDAVAERVHAFVRELGAAGAR
ncbi:alpha/beta fold hydrolase [Nocardiopsis composta]